MVQYASAMKMTMFSGIIAAVLNPFSATSHPILAVLFSAALIVLIAVAVGLVESLVARLRFRALPLFTFAAFMAVLVALVVITAHQGEFQ
jgi:formate hydrogenlyase subunit 4